jgi:hypothetical protein
LDFGECSSSDELASGSVALLHVSSLYATNAAIENLLQEGLVRMTIIRNNE